MNGIIIFNKFLYNFRFFDKIQSIGGAVSAFSMGECIVMILVKLGTFGFEEDFVPSISFLPIVFFIFFGFIIYVWVPSPEFLIRDQITQLRKMNTQESQIEIEELQNLLEDFNKE